MKYSAVLASLVALVSSSGHAATNYFTAFTAKQCQVQVPKSAMSIKPFEPTSSSQMNYCFDQINFRSCSASANDLSLRQKYISMCAAVPNGDQASMSKFIMMSRRNDATTCKETIKCMLMISDAQKGADTYGCSSYLTSVGYDMNIFTPQISKSKANQLMSVYGYKTVCKKSGIANAAKSAIAGAGVRKIKSGTAGTLGSKSAIKSMKTAGAKSAGVKKSAKMNTQKRSFRTNNRVKVNMN